jgi:AMMECR1 domain-containing protein
VRLQTLILAALFPIVCNAQSAPATSEKKVSGRLTKPVAVAALPPRTMTKSPPRVMAMSARVNLPQLARQALAVHFHASRFDSLDKLIEATPVCDEYKKPAGLFITLSRHGKTRACWGSITPTSQDLVRATVLTTEAALRKEYRYPVVRESEWPLLKAQVTIVRSVEPIADIGEQNALKYGLLVQYGEHSAVLLPGEVIDARCQLLKCKLKAGIPVNQPCQLYRIRADVLK